jgi:hypothetical protein
LQLSGDAKTLTIAGMALSLQTSGATRVARRDGASVLDLTSDGAAAFAGITAAPVTSTTVAWGIADADGYAALSIAPDGSASLGGVTLSRSGTTATVKGPDGTAALTIGAGGIPVLAGASFVVDPRTDFALGFADDQGFLGFALKADGTALGTGLGGSTSSTYGASDYLARDAAAKDYSTTLRLRLNTTTARLYWDYNHVISYGQSLSIGVEGWPALSPASAYGNLMAGVCVQGNTGSTWSPRGSNTLQTMAAACPSGTGVLTPTQQAALVDGDGQAGETPLEGACNFFKRMINLNGQVLDDPRKLVAYPRVPRRSRRWCRTARPTAFPMFSGSRVRTTMAAPTGRPPTRRATRRT